MLNCGRKPCMLHISHILLHQLHPSNAASLRCLQPDAVHAAPDRQKSGLNGPKCDKDSISQITESLCMLKNCNFSKKLTVSFLLRKNQVNGFSFAYVACQHGSLAMLILHRISMVFPRDSGRSEPVESKTTQMWRRQGHHLQPYSWTGPSFSYQLLGTQVVQRPNSLEAPNLIRQIRDQLNMAIAMENGPFDWLSRCISYWKRGDIPASYVSLPEGIWMFPKIVVPPNHQF